MLPMEEAAGPRATASPRTEACTEPKTAPQRARYSRRPGSGLSALGGTKLDLLASVGTLAFISLEQLAFAVGLSQKATRRHMRVLFDSALVEVVAVSRDALGPPAAARQGPVLGGSAPNFFRLTPAGASALKEAGREADGGGDFAAGRRAVPSALWIAHQVLVGDAFAWLHRCTREHGHALERWRDGVRAEIPLGRERPPRAARPDAWFVISLGAHALVGLLEADRGTEKGGRRWGEKLEAYGQLFAGGQLQRATGYAGARVVVIAPDPRRRDWLATFIENNAPTALAGRFWLAERAALRVPRLDEPAWRRPLDPGLHRIVPAEMLDPTRTERPSAGFHTHLPGEHR